MELNGSMNTDILKQIRQYLPNRFEILIRINYPVQTNHNEKWFIHLYELNPNENNPNRYWKHITWFKAYSDDLDFLINSVIDIINTEILK